MSVERSPSATAPGRHHLEIPQHLLLPLALAALLLPLAPLPSPLLATARRSPAIAASPPPPRPPPHQAMELFPDGGFVLLRSRARTSQYVHADGDWFGVSLRPLGVGTAASLESVWRVHHMPVPADQGGVFVLLLLQNAAYGRCLCFSPFAQAGHRGHCAVQAEPPNNPLNAFQWGWRVDRVDANLGYVRLRSGNSPYHLRANGRLRRWNTGVTVERNNHGRRLSTMMQWTVHVVPASAVPLPLPAAAPPQPQQGGRSGLLFWRRTENRGPGVNQHPARTIWYVRASDEGNFDQNHHNWRSIDIYYHSVFHLRTQLGQLQNDWDGDMLRFTLCMRSGWHGRLMPLVADLPRGLDPMYIVILRTGSAAAAELRYPTL